jgi:hypothetical protein
MDRKQLLAAGAAAAGASLVGAGAAEAGADQGAVGSWFGTVTATDPPLGQFNDLLSLNEGGVVTESRRYYVPVTPVGPLLETTGHGQWVRTGNRTYEAFFRFLLQQAPPSSGEPVGTDNIRLKLQLEGDVLTGTFESNIKDPSDNVIFVVKGTYSATRITT